MTQFARFSSKNACRAVAQKAKTRQNTKNTVSRSGDGVFACARLYTHVALSDCGAGAVTSVRVTPLENVMLLRMAEKSPDMLR